MSLNQRYMGAPSHERAVPIGPTTHQEELNPGPCRFGQLKAPLKGVNQCQLTTALYKSLNPATATPLSSACNMVLLKAITVRVQQRSGYIQQTQFHRRLESDEFSRFCATQTNFQMANV